MQVECRHISYRYPGASGAVFADIDVAIDTPGFHALFGTSGVGKTTLAKILSGQIGDFEGRIRYHEARRVLYTFNMERLPGWSSVKDHFARIADPSGGQRLDELVATFGIQACLASRFHRLSLGQQNRANLIRYLLQDFDVLVMDESLANVDELTREKIILKIKTMFPERGFVYISHNVAEVAKLCRQIIVLRSPDKQPQVVCIAGCDHRESGQPEPARLERVMLETVHAA